MGQSKERQPTSNAGAAQDAAQPKPDPAWAWRLTCGARASADPTRPRDEDRGDGSVGAATGELADGDSSGELDNTGVLPKFPRVD